MRFVSCLYLPSLAPTAPQARRWKQLLTQWPPRRPMYVFTDWQGEIEEFWHQIPNLAVIPIPTIGPFTQTLGTQGTRPADRYAYWIFVAVLQKMLDVEADWFYYLEGDCYVQGAWDTAMEYEVAQQPNAWIAGTPVCWYPWQVNDVWSQRLVEFAYHVQRKTGRAMQFEGATFGPWPTALYPNGALAVYSPFMIADVFAEALNEYCRPTLGFDRERWAVEQHTFDLRIGIFCTQRYGLEWLDRFIVTKTAYSTYAPYRASTADLMTLLKSGFTAVHPIK